jgi:hypothetical protein
MKFQESVPGSATMTNFFRAFLTGLVLLIYGLNIPGISLYILLLAVIALFFTNVSKVEYQKAFVERLLLLMFFAASYYAFTTIHGITGFREAIRNFLAVTGAYALGFSLTCGEGKDIDRTVPMVLLLMITGFLTFSFLSVYSFLHTSDLIEIAERNAPSFWDGSEINAPGLGANASLGMCLLPVVFFGGTENRRWSFYILTAVIIAMFLAGIYVNVILQNRAPFIATAVSLFLGALVYVYSNRKNPSGIMKKIALTGLLAAIIAYYLTVSVDLTQFTIFFRFTEVSLASGRLDAWNSLLSSLHHSLLGGRVVRLGEDLEYVHNLWLDVIWDAGVISVVSLLAFHLKHVACFKSILKSELPLSVILLIVGLGTSFFVNFMQEPTMSASVPYFAASCFFLGLVLRISQYLESRNDAS